MGAESISFLSGRNEVEVSSTNPLPVVSTIDQSTSAFKATATFTPAASGHTTPAVNGGAQEFTGAGNNATSILITGAELEIDGGTAEATAWRLYLYSVTPPSALTDTTTFDVPSGDRASYLGYIDLGTA